MLTTVFYVVEWGKCTFLGTFPELRIATVSLALPVLCLCVFRTEQLGSHWTDFHEIWYLSMLRKFDRNNESYT
jgi:hypothetical protein